MSSGGGGGGAVEKTIFVIGVRLWAARSRSRLRASSRDTDLLRGGGLCSSPRAAGLLLTPQLRPPPPPPPFCQQFGAVGQAWLRFVKHVAAKGLMTGIKKIRYFAPEIKEFKDEGLFEFNNGPFVTRETLVPLLDRVRFFRSRSRGH